MSRTRWLLVLAALLVWAPVATAQKVHAVLVGDTNDGTIGIGVNANVTMMSKFLASVRTVGQIEIEEHVVKGSDFSCASIRKAVDGLNVGPTDTVVFYYSAHGFRTPGTPTKFPDFDCARDGSGTRAGMSMVVETLSKKKPQFLIAIADTCNVLLEKPPADLGVRFAPLVAREAWQRLFLRYKGKIILSGSEPGTFSWYRNDELAGGLFTQQFISAIADTMKKVARTQDPEMARWSDIYRASTKKIVFDAAHSQQPQGEKEMSVR